MASTSTSGVTITGTAMQLTPLRVSRPTQRTTTAAQPPPISVPVAALPVVAGPPPATALLQHPLSGTLKVVMDELKVCKDEVQRSSALLKQVVEDNKKLWALIAQQSFTVENSGYKVYNFNCIHACMCIQNNIL